MCPTCTDELLLLIRHPSATDEDTRSLVNLMFRQAYQEGRVDMASENYERRYGQSAPDIPS